MNSRKARLCWVPFRALQVWCLAAQSEPAVETTESVGICVGRSPAWGFDHDLGTSSWQ